jgi:hypothetical protein
LVMANARVGRHTAIMIIAFRVSMPPTGRPDEWMYTAVEATGKQNLIVLGGLGLENTFGERSLRQYLAIRSKLAKHRSIPP